MTDPQPAARKRLITIEASEHVTPEKVANALRFRANEYFFFGHVADALVSAAETVKYEEPAND